MGGGYDIFFLKNSFLGHEESHHLITLTQIFQVY